MWCSRYGDEYYEDDNIDITGIGDGDGDNSDHDPVCTVSTATNWTICQCYQVTSC